MSDKTTARLVQRLWDSDDASALTNQAAREIERLCMALQQIVDMSPKPGGVGQIARDALRVCK